MIAWSIETIVRSNLFERVLVSTDDAEIAEVAARYGAEVPFMRPAELSDDHTVTFDVIRHAIRWCDDNVIHADHFCCVYATAPFLTAESLAQGLASMQEGSASFAFSVTSFEFPIQRALMLSPRGILEAVWPANNLVRSQDLEPRYHDAGQFYWGTRAAFLENRDLYSGNAVPIILPRTRVQDIDTPEDWERAELMFRVAVEAAK